MVEAAGTEDPVECFHLEVARTWVLREVGDSARAANLPVGGLRLAGEHFRQRGLAGAVASHEADPVTGRDLEGHRLQQLATGYDELEVGDGQHGGRSVA